MPQPPEPQGSCPRCGAVTQPLQQYCLECGTRLPQEPGLFAAFAHVESRFVPALVFLFVSAVATTAAVAAAPGGGGVPTVVATQSVTVGPGTRTTAAPATSTVATTPSPTLTTGPLPTAPGSTGVTATSPTTTIAPPPGGLVSWPAGKRGYTDVLESIPAADGRGVALARARSALRAGLPQAGVLLSSDYGSLHPGYYVVFSGIYGGATEATSALAEAQSRGFPDAYPARVSP